jgi:hypothetical protein
MKYSFHIPQVLLLAVCSLLCLSCGDDDDVTVGNIVISESELTKTIEWDEVESSISFTADAPWTATVSDATTRATNTQLDWLKLTVSSGEAGDMKMPFLVSKNDNDTYREAQITISCGGASSVITVHQEANPNVVHTMDPSEIPNYDKYYLPASSNEGFEKGAAGMLRSDARWSWWRMKQSDHFFVFWEPGFGDNPNADSIPEALRVDVDDLLAKAEKFYDTNITKLGMAVTGQGKSQLDNYKMEIYLLYQTEWLATGSGYDNVIGALWVNPSTCKPVGSTIAHEIGHSFQYQVSADKLLTGEGQLTDYGANVGFRYGFGENGAGGCAFWEQCAQWQSFQDYPEEAFTQDANVQVWLKNHHRHFNHEWQRYASYWLQYYYTQKHGIGAYSSIWRESMYPEDPVQAYMRLYCDNSLDNLYDDLYDYATRCADYDFDAVHQYRTDASLNYATKLYGNGGSYQVGYENCPGTTGFNLIPLNVPAAGTEVSATLQGVTPGSALPSGDPGTVVDGDGNTKGHATNYNTQSNQAENFRFGFVAVTDNGSHYGTMSKGKNGEASMEVPSGTTRLYFCVLGAPDTYNRQAWDDDETNDEQWPYRVSFSGTDLLGNVTIPEGAPEDITISHEVSCDASSAEYLLGSLNLLNNGDMGKIAQAFKMQPSEIAAATLAAGDVTAEGPAEGQIAVALTNPDGSLSYSYSANGTGFWVAADGSASSWGEAPIYFEYSADTYGLNYGHHPGKTESGKSYVLKPTFVYNHGGTLYKAVVTLTMKF